MATSTPGQHGYGILGVADATGNVNLFTLNDHDTSMALTLWKTWKMNQSSSLCLSVDWSDRGPASESQSDAQLAVSQSDGSLAVVASLSAPVGLDSHLSVWSAHDYEAWITAWDCWSNGSVIWSGKLLY